MTMATLAETQRDRELLPRLRRFSGAELARMTAVGLLTEYDHVELLDGLILVKLEYQPGFDGSTASLVRRFTVAEYHQLIQLGILGEADRVELIDGMVVKKMARNPPHDSTLQKTNKRLAPLLPSGWEIRVQMAVTLLTGEPEPDIAVAREDPDDYGERHPNGADVGLVVEVADSSLATDRWDKLPGYAEAQIPVYWIVNIEDRQVEVHELPSGLADLPGYGRRTVYRNGNIFPILQQTIYSAPQ